MNHQPRPPALPTDLTGRVVFVAGGGSAGPGWSIGRAACVTYARQGARVCVVDRDAASAEETTALIHAEGGEAVTLIGDVALEADVLRLFAEAKAHFGPIDVLHHNVGIGQTGGPMETSADDFDRIHAVNVRSLLLSSQQVLPGMRQRGHGTIINVTSVVGRLAALAQSLGRSKDSDAEAETDIERVRALETYFAEGGFFSHGLEGEVLSRAGHTAERIATLLGGDQMIGDDEQYAVVMALAACE